MPRRRGAAAPEAGQCRTDSQQTFPNRENAITSVEQKSPGNLCVLKVGELYAQTFIQHFKNQIVTDNQALFAKARYRSSADDFF